MELWVIFVIIGLILCMLTPCLCIYLIRRKVNKKSLPKVNVSPPNIPIPVIPLRKSIPSIATPSEDLPEEPIDFTSITPFIPSDWDVIPLPSEKAKPIVTEVENMVNETWLYRDRLGRDAINLMHKGIHVKAIYVLHNEAQMESYMDAIEKLNSQINLPSSVDVEADVLTKPSSIDSALNNIDSSLPTRSDDINEVYLFHGTKNCNVFGIMTEGFQMKCSNHGLYGKALYMAESSEKADQYTDEMTNRRNKYLCMVLVRTALGRIYPHKNSKALSALPCTKQSCMAKGCEKHLPKYNSAVAGLDKRFREFLLHDVDRCYPHVFVFYEREFCVKRRRGNQGDIPCYLVGPQNELESFVPSTEQPTEQINGLTENQHAAEKNITDYQEKISELSIENGPIFFTVSSMLGEKIAMNVSDDESEDDNVINNEIQRQTSFNNEADNLVQRHCDCEKIPICHIQRQDSLINNPDDYSACRMLKKDSFMNDSEDSYNRSIERQESVIIDCDSLPNDSIQGEDSCTSDLVSLPVHLVQRQDSLITDYEDSHDKSIMRQDSIRRNDSRHICGHSIERQESVIIDCEDTDEESTQRQHLVRNDSENARDHVIQRQESVIIDCDMSEDSTGREGSVKSPNCSTLRQDSFISNSDSASETSFDKHLASLNVSSHLLKPTYLRQVSSVPDSDYFTDDSIDTASINGLRGRQVFYRSNSDYFYDDSLVHEESSKIYSIGDNINGPKQSTVNIEKQGSSIY